MLKKSLSSRYGLERKDHGGLLNINAPPLQKLGECSGEASLHACPVLGHFGDYLLLAVAGGGAVG